MTLKYLITGATGGLGDEVLKYFVANVPASEYAAASSKASNIARFEDRGIAFRHVDYDDGESLDSGLRDVENLLFVSTNVIDNERRERQHRRVIDAAKKAGVKHVWYTSFAFGGFSNESKSAVQQVHLKTERLLEESGLTYTSMRQGFYTKAFPVFLNWRPESTSITLPVDGEVAYTCRAELGEATARIMLRGGYENRIVLFTAGESITSKEVVDTINETTGRQVDFKIVSFEEYARLNGKDYQGEGAVAFFEMISTWWEEIGNGALSTTDPLLRRILGREPTKPRDALRELLMQDPDYIWHQEYVK